uniref:Uncharacterized protein n=1 Tax=Romanomermis culicivorax TaxID=13658 RepID=A0A915I1X0_ROMCU
MPNEITTKILAINPTPPSLRQPISKPTLTISAASATGDHTTEHRTKESTYAVYLNPNFTSPWEQHIHYNAAPALM